MKVCEQGAGCISIKGATTSLFLCRWHLKALLAQEDPIIALVICENDGDVFVLEDRKSRPSTVA